MILYTFLGSSEAEQNPVKVEVGISKFPRGATKITNGARCLWGDSLNTIKFDHGI